MNSSRNTVVFLSFLFFLAVPLHAVTTSNAITQDMDSFIVQIKQDFDGIVASSIVKQSAIAPVNKRFLQALKTHQQYYSLVRTNKKGIVLNERVRLAEGTDVKKKDMSKEEWFKYASTKRAEYSDCFLEESNGRYYLLWAAPILSKSTSSLLGIIALKIDLWDCYHIFSKTTEIPFLVRMDRKGLYSHKWEDTISYSEEPLSIPGIKRISVRYPKIITDNLTPVDTQVTSTAIVDSSSSKAIVSLKKAQDKQMVAIVRIIISVIIVLIIILSILIARYIAAHKKIQSTKKNDKWDRL